MLVYSLYEKSEQISVSSVGDRVDAAFHQLPSYHYALEVMSVPRAEYDPRRIFVFSCPSLPFFKQRRAVGVYAAGALVRRPLS